MSLFFSLMVLVSVLGAALAQDQLRVAAWQNVDNISPSKDFEFPESAILQGRANVALGFTGGGSRSYLASFGYLAGLTELGLMQKIKYIGGISGGSWATGVYTYAQNHDGSNPAEEEQFLGPIVQPADITEDGLKQMDPKCARGLTNSKYTTIALKHMMKAPSLGEMWCYATQQVYMNPVGITEGAHWSYSQATVDDIKSRNPSLADQTFLLPTSTDRPYPIIGAALLGPSAGAPYNVKRNNQNFTMMEFTPMYSGQVRTLAVDYHLKNDDDSKDDKEVEGEEGEEGAGLLGGRKDRKSKRRNKYGKSDEVVSRTMGGFLETYAFPVVASSTANISSPATLAPGATTGMLAMSAPAKVLDVGHATCASSYAPGAFMSSFPLGLEKKLGLHYDYSSPASPVANTVLGIQDTLFGDGGSYENIPLISYLQRGVKRVVWFANHVTPLQDASQWDVSTDPAKSGSIDDSVQAFFGYFIPEDHHYEDRSFEYTQNHVFDQSQFAPFIQGMQAAQLKGSGAVYRTTLTTVNNDWWGIDGGVSVDVTIVYLGRCPVWEKQLTSDMQALVIPKAELNGGPFDPTDLTSKKTFKHFPHYKTQGADIDFDAANLLSDLAGWTIQQNKDMFNDIVQNW